jgi:hypothetical protein
MWRFRVLHRSGAPMTDARCQKALEESLASLRCDSGTVHLRRGDAPILQLAAAHAIPPPVLEVVREIPWGKGMAGLAVERVAPVGTCNLQTTRSADVRPGAKATELRGTLVVPMLLGDAVVGAFGVGCRAERTFTVEETRALWDAAAALARETAPEPLSHLRAAISQQVDDAGRGWFEERLAAAQRGDRAALVAAFPQVSRKLSRGPLGRTDALVIDGEEVPLRGFRVDDAGRAALLYAFTGDRQALARELYFQGDSREKAGALRALSLVGEDDAAIDAVLDAVRLAAVELVEAAMAENRYGAHHLPAHEWKRAVLKCAFVGIALFRLPRLVARADTELTQMLLSLVSEREAAGRPVPPDLWPVASLQPVDGLLAKLIGYLEHASPQHRANAALGLLRFEDAAARRFLEERAARETDPEVMRALTYGLPYL